MVVAGALPCALTSADEARGDPCRLSTTSVRTPRWLRTNTMASGLAPAGSAAAQFLIVQEIAGDVDGSHRPGFARQPTEIRIVLVALRAAMGIVRLPQELPAMTNLFGAQSPAASTVPADPESRFSFTQEAPFEYAAR